MAYVLLVVAVVFLWLDYLGSKNLKAAGSLLYSEMFEGSPPFYKFAGAIVIVGAIGYVPDMRRVSTMLLVLITLVIVLKHNSEFIKLIKDA